MRVESLESAEELIASRRIVPDVVEEIQDDVLALALERIVDIELIHLLRMDRKLPHARTADDEFCLLTSSDPVYSVQQRLEFFLNVGRCIRTKKQRVRHCQGG